MVKGLFTLHKKNILHRDIKSANIFLTINGIEAKLGDLNVSKVIKQGMGRTQTGTPYYAAPEIWKDESYGTKCDIWSLGCVLYETVAQKPPFRAKNMVGLYCKIKKGLYEPIPDIYSENLRKTIAKMLNVDS